MFKKTAIAALVLGFSGVASAAMYAPAPAPACSAGNVTVPCEASAWDIGADALYLRNQENIFSPLAGNQSDWGWGFRIEGSYHFGTGNDVNVNWAHISKKTKDIFSFNHTFDGVTADVGADLNSKLDQVNFEFGQMANFGENVMMRFHGGFAYARLQNSPRVGAEISGIPGQTTPLEPGFSVSGKGTGWGPRAGVDLTYDFGNGFSVFGNTAVAIYSSTFTISGVDFTGIPADVIPTGIDKLINGKSYGSVTEAEARLGAMYTHTMSQGDLTLRAGWETRNFINATAISDLAWNGIFFGLKWVGNA